MVALDHAIIAVKLDRNALDCAFRLIVITDSVPS